MLMLNVMLKLSCLAYTIMCFHDILWKWQKRDTERGRAKRAQQIPRLQVSTPINLNRHNNSEDTIKKNLLCIIFNAIAVSTVVTMTVLPMNDKLLCRSAKFRVYLLIYQFGHDECVLTLTLKHKHKQDVCSAYVLYAYLCTAVSRFLLTCQLIFSAVITVID